jgi:hypothetical protein
VKPRSRGTLVSPRALQVFDSRTGVHVPRLAVIAQADGSVPGRGLFEEAACPVFQNLPCGMMP